MRLRSSLRARRTASAASRARRLGGLLVVAAELHFAEHAFALQLLLKRFERLIDIVVTNENLHLAMRSTKKLKTGKREARPIGAVSANCAAGL